MNIKEVKDLIHEVLQSDISEFELEHTGTRLKLKRGNGQDSTIVAAPQALAAAPHSSQPEAVVSVETDEVSEEADLHVITSPIVGTFYRASSPGAEPYVKSGDHVDEGTILCIVEAMKLMNEIMSDVEGEIARVYVENSEPVEYGQKLFGIRTRKQD